MQVTHGSGPNTLENSLRDTLENTRQNAPGKSSSAQADEAQGGQAGRTLKVSFLRAERAGAALAGDAQRGLNATDTVTDTATLSPQAHLLSLALSGDAYQPAKVQTITSAIAGGTYSVDPAEVASALMTTMLHPSRE